MKCGSKTNCNKWNYFINIKNINLRNMYASNIKILQTKKDTNKFIMAEKGEFNKNIFSLENVIYYNFKKEEYRNLPNYNLIINFNKDNIINSISKYKLVPFYNYTIILNNIKFNLYSPEIGLYYLSK